MVLGIVTGSMIVPVFVIDARADVNNPLPLMVPKFETVPAFETVPEFEREPPELIVRVWPEFIVKLTLGGNITGKLSV